MTLTFKIGFATAEALSAFELPLLEALLKTGLHGLGEIFVLSLVLFYGLVSTIYWVSYFLHSRYREPHEFYYMLVQRILKDLPIICLTLLISAVIEVYISIEQFFKLVS